MVAYQFLFDDFNDNVIDTNRWVANLPNSGLQTESGGVLRTPSAVSSAPTVMLQDKNFYDLRKGRLAVKFTRSGTANGNIYTYFGFSDPQDNWFTQWWRSNDHTIQVAINALGTGTETQTETTVGLGPSWVNGTWLGWTYTEATKTYSLGKSTNGTTWTEIYKYVVTTTGALNYKQVGFILGAMSYNGASTNFTPHWDDVSYFATDTAMQTKVRFNGAWVNAMPKVRVNGAWKRSLTKQRFGGNWGQ